MHFQTDRSFPKTMVIGLLLAAGCTEAPTSTSTSSPSGGKADGPGQAGDVRTLRCSSEGANEFRATLDGSTYDPGSGLFDVRDAAFRDNYATADLICTGHSLAAVDCIGFWLDLPEQVGEVTTTSSATGVTAAYATVRGDLVGMSNVPWPCSVE